MMLSSIEKMLPRDGSLRLVVSNGGGGGRMSVPKIEVLNGEKKNRSKYELTVDGERVTLDRVTSLLNGFPKPALAYAQANEAALAAIGMGGDIVKEAALDPEALKKKLAASAFPVWKIRAATGTAVHAMVEAHVLGSGRMPLVPEGVNGQEVKDMFDQYLRFEEHYKPEYVATEIQVINLTDRYAGTTDLLARIGERLLIIDVKCTKRASDGSPGVYLEQAGQLSMYRHAEYLFDGRAGITEAMPDIQGCCILWLGRDDYELCPMDTGERTYELAMHAAEVHRGISNKDKNAAGGPWWRSTAIVQGAAA